MSLHRKMSQVAQFFIDRDKAISKEKLLTLFLLAETLSLLRWNTPMFGCGYVAIIENEKPFLKMDELSKAEFGLLQYIWEKYGNYSYQKLKEEIKRNYGIWEEPRNNNMTVNYEKILNNKGHSKKIAKKIDDGIKALNYVDELFEKVL